MYTYIYGNVLSIRDKANMIDCILFVFGSNTMNYSLSYFTFLFLSLKRPQAPFSDLILSKKDNSLISNSYFIL